MEMINWLEEFLSDENTKIWYLLAMILIANIIDFVIGWVNAKFNKEVEFSSSKAIYGIARKLIMFMVLVFFVPVSLIPPEPIGQSALYVLFIGYLLSEINSILNHLNLTSDDKSMSMFSDFIQHIFYKGGGKK